MTPEENWTDGRLDDLSKKVDDGFVRVDTDIRELKGEMNQRFEKVEGKIESGVKELRGEMNTRFLAVDTRLDSLHARFDSLQRSLFVATIVIVGAMIGTNAF